MARARKAKSTKTSKARAGSGGGNGIGFERELFELANNLRKNLEPSEYKHVVLGLIFLKYVSDSFDACHRVLLETPHANPENPDEYSAAGVPWIPREARWGELRNPTPKQKGKSKKGEKGGLEDIPPIGIRIDKAMQAIEASNDALKGVLPTGYGRPSLDNAMLAGLVDLIDNRIPALSGEAEKDLLGRVYEYFLNGFAGAEGKRGGEFFTPRSVVDLLVAMLEPLEGRVYDPCCGSGGMFVQSSRFAKAHNKDPECLSIFGQESNYTTWKLCKMNLAVRGVDGEMVKWNNEGSFLRDEHPDIRARHVLANPPFNSKNWGRTPLKEDSRWRFGLPPENNANFAWLQHIYRHLGADGTGGIVLANGSMSSTTNGEGDIRRAMVEADTVDAMVALPGQLFFSTPIPACLWFLAQNKDGRKRKPAWRDRRGEVLMIDARDMGQMVDRTRRELTTDDIDRIADTYHAWRGQPSAKREYKDVPGFCHTVTLEEIAGQNYILTPGRYVGAAAKDEDSAESFDEHMRHLAAEWGKQAKEGARLDLRIRANLEALGYGA